MRLLVLYTLFLSVNVILLYQVTLFYIVSGMIEQFNMKYCNNTYQLC